MLFKKYIAVAAALLIAAGMMAGCKKSGNESEIRKSPFPITALLYQSLFRRVKVRLYRRKAVPFLK